MRKSSKPILNIRARTVNSGRCRETFDGRGGVIRRVGWHRVYAHSLKEFGEINLIVLQKLRNKKKCIY